jgi:hypothetical protein
MFEKVTDAKTQGARGNRPVPGHYIGMIERIKAGESQQGKGPFVAIELRNMLTLADGDIPVSESFEPLGKDAWHRPGESITQILMERNQMFLVNFKSMVVAIGNITEAEVDKQKCEQVTGGAFDGLFVEWVCRPQRKKNGELFNAMYYQREVPSEEVKRRVPKDILDLVLGEGVIDEILKNEAAAAAKAQAQQG